MSLDLQTLIDKLNPICRKGFDNGYNRTLSPYFRKLGETMSNHDLKIVVQPPWVMYPASNVLEMGPVWGGWRQGPGEAWLCDVWLPFWKQLTPEEQSAYLKQYPLPNEDWHLYLTHYWK